MARKDLPYLPFYVQDFITDEKLTECSASATGVYIRLMCIMHKSFIYGKIELRAKYKQNISKTKSKENCISEMLIKYMPYPESVIHEGVSELLKEGVIFWDGDFLCQKRMVSDGELSKKRAISGSKGGKNVKNSHTKKLYNEPGFIYVFSDVNSPNTFKIGISKDPTKRLLQISNKLKKQLECVFVEACDDMGILEDNILTAFDKYRDGEWIYGVEFIEITKAIQKQNKSKTNANTDIDIDINNKEKISNSTKVLFNNMPVSENFNGLPEVKINASIELVRITGNVNITSKQVKDIWEVFKVQHLTGKKYYADRDAVFSHFINWIKTQKFNNGNKINSTVGKEIIFDKL